MVQHVGIIAPFIGEVLVAHQAFRLRLDYGKRIAARIPAVSAESTAQLKGLGRWPAERLHRGCGESVACIIQVDTVARLLTLEQIGHKARIGIAAPLHVPGPFKPGGSRLNRAASATRGRPGSAGVRCCTFIGVAKSTRELCCNQQSTQPNSYKIIVGAADHGYTEALSTLMARGVRACTSQNRGQSVPRRRGFPGWSGFHCLPFCRVGVR